MAFASAEADIHLAANDGVQGVVVPVAQTNQCLRVALIDALGELNRIISNGVSAASSN
jgi:hypothetical protein